MFPRVQVIGAALLALLAWPPPAGAAAPPVGGGWRYVVPPAGDPFEHPPPRALALSATRPDDVVEAVRYRGKQRRYAQLRFGSRNSVRVTVVVDGVGPGEVDLYVDARRRRRIEARDRVAGCGLRWRMPLEVALVEGTVVRTVRRTVVFRYGAVGRTLSFAAAGYIEGKVRVDGRRYRVRRTDGDGNGLFTDPDDRVWVDRDGDGRWDRAGEQFLYAPILTLG